MHKGSTRLAILAALALVAGGAALNLYLHPRERALLPRATRITPVSNNHPYYWWLADHEIMLFRDPARSDWTLVRVNESTKRQQPLSALTRLFARSGGKPGSIQVSPDGKWMLWTNAAGGTVVSRTDGARHFDYPPGKPSEKRWMCESVRWIELVHDGKFFSYAVMHDIVNPHKAQRRVLVPSIPCTREFVDVAGMRPTADDHILAGLWNGQEGNLNPAGIIALNMNAHLSAVGQYRLDPPHAADRAELEFAPLYGRLAWVLEYGPGLSALVGASGQTGLWVTDMFGWKSRELGSLETSPDDSSSSRPVSIQWTPDGGRLSFVYRDALWTVPTG
jgi:hypothetical protein